MWFLHNKIPRALILSKPNHGIVEYCKTQSNIVGNCCHSCLVVAQLYVKTYPFVGNGHKIA